MLEAIEDEPVVASGIRIHRPGRPDRVACQSWSRNYLSVTRSRSALFAKTADFLARRHLSAQLGCGRVVPETGEEDALGHGLAALGHGLLAYPPALARARWVMAAEPTPISRLLPIVQASERSLMATSAMLWGGAAYTGTNTSGDTTNDADGNFNPPFMDGLPYGGNIAVRFIGAAGDLSTNNAADYALSASPATLTTNDGTGSALGDCVQNDGFEVITE